MSPFIRCFCRSDDKDDGECDPEVDKLSANLADTSIVDKPDIDWDTAHSEVARIFSSSIPDRESTRQSSALPQQPPRMSGNLNVRARCDPVGNYNSLPRTADFG